MHSLHLKTKLAIAISFAFLLASFASISVQVHAQAHGGTAGTITGGPLPAGVTPEFTYQPHAYLSFSPNPIGIGQELLVNAWTIPAPGANRAHTGYTITITKPDGTTYVVGPVNSFVADGTYWFTYVPDQIGTWKIQFTYAGDYYPAGRYVDGLLNNSAGPGGFLDQRDYPSTYYLPDSTQEQTLTVQQDLVASWPPSALPTDYWSRPISLENREWYTIGGNYPYSYFNSITAYAGPFVQGPNTAHVLWRQQGDLGGLIGGETGIYGLQGRPGTPSVIYLGRCYQTMTVPINGVPTSSAVCYDLRTGEQYYAIPVAQGGVTPSYLSYNKPSSAGSVLGTESSSYTVDLLTISGGRLYKINPLTGAVSFNASISPVSTGTFHSNNYMLSVQRIGSGPTTEYRLINWTTAGTSTDFATRVVGNVSWPVSTAPGNLGLNADFDTGVAVGTIAGIFGSGSGGRAVTGDFGLAGGAYGTRIVGISMITGQVLYNFTTDDTSFYPSSDSVGEGKIAIPMDGRIINAYELTSGKLAWQAKELDYPFGGFGAYSAASAYGLFFWPTYDGVCAFDWSTGKRVWHFQYVGVPFESPYIMANGTNQYPFFGSSRIADGKIYTFNTEHTPTQPVERGWRIFALNATTGEEIWNVTGPMTPGAVADGYLTAGNAYDGYMYVFGKGKSATTVTAPDTVMPLGDGVVIRGTVMDMSPGQPDTPCVSKDSMTNQMEYLHMQHPIDGINHDVTMTGVPVSLTAIDESGSYIDIGTVTTSAYFGTFEKAWTPPAEGTYRIIASFAGDDSYGSSGASTAVSVGPAAPEITIPEQPTPPDYTMTIIGGVIAVIIAVAIVGVALFFALRKR